MITIFMAVSNLLSNTFFFLILKDLVQIERDFLGDMIHPQSSMWVRKKKKMSKLRVGTQMEMNGALFRRRRRNSILSRERTKKTQRVNMRGGRNGEPYNSWDGLRTSHTIKVWYLIFHFNVLLLCSIPNLWESSLHSPKSCLGREKTCVQIIERRLLPVCVSAKAG